jgi:hypothetical protein
MAINPAYSHEPCRAVEGIQIGVICMIATGLHDPTASRS